MNRELDIYLFNEISYNFETLVLLSIIKIILQLKMNTLYTHLSYKIENINFCIKKILPSLG